jgi:sulfur relay (sulfurtransferase) DsrC/TusE family protein
MKFLHYLRDNYYENVEVCEAAHWLLKELKIEMELEEMPKYLLNLFREIDKRKR